jgi:hypothetical protein
MSSFDIHSSLDKHFNESDTNPQQAFEEVLLDYQKSGNLILDVGNPENRPSLTDDAFHENLGNTKYVCLNPGNTDTGKHEFKGNTCWFYQVDAYHHEEINEIIKKLNGKNTIYTIFRGVSQILNYYMESKLGKNARESINDTGKIEPYNKSSIELLTKRITQTKSKYILFCVNIEDREGIRISGSTISTDAFKYLVKSLEKWDWDLEIRKGSQRITLTGKR